MTARPPVVVAGVSGSGKTTLGHALAEQWNAPFVDGDDLHPSENRAKMARGEALDDADRAPWLAAVGAWLTAHPDGVVACSALARRYRDRLREDAPGAVTVLLRADADLLERRLRRRTHHFMPASLLESQLATLEPLGDDERGLTLDALGDEHALVRRVDEFLRGDVGGPS